MKTIYKYPIAKNEQTVSIKGLVKLLNVKEQYNSIVLYAIVDTENDIEHIIKVKIFGTGHNNVDVTQDDIYLDTVSLMGGNLMWHVFISSTTKGV